MRLILCLLLGLIIFSRAEAAEPIANPYAELVDDVFPNSGPPLTYGTELFRWSGAEGLPAGTKIDFIPGSIQWSRVHERLILPRVRVKIEVPGVDGAQLEVQSRLSPLRRSLKGSFFGEAVIPLVSGLPSRIVLRIRKAGVDSESAVSLERIPNPLDQFGIDATCSPWGVEITAREIGKKEKKGNVILSACRMIRGESSEGMVALLDVLLFVDGSGDSIRVNGVVAKAEAPSLFRLRLSTQAQPFILEMQSGESYDLKTKIPPRLNRGFFGLGFGPYQYRFTAPDTDVTTTAGIATIYGSYQVAETVRFTAFNATAIHKNYFSDSGFYVKTESVKLLDQKVTLFVMLGANFVGFKYSGTTHFNFGAPQGFEAVYYDFLASNRTGTIGAFIYPPIEGKSYYNVWARYGAPGFFVELNYIAIRTKLESDTLDVKSAGLSVGFPLARFF